MTYIKLKLDELVAECEKRNIDVEYYKEKAKSEGRRTKKVLINVLVDDDMEVQGGLESNRQPIKHVGEEPKHSVDEEFIKKHGKYRNYDLQRPLQNLAFMKYFLDRDDLDIDVTSKIFDIERSHNPLVSHFTQHEHRNNMMARMLDEKNKYDPYLEWMQDYFNYEPKSEPDPELEPEPEPEPQSAGYKKKRNTKKRKPKKHSNNKRGGKRSKSKKRKSKKKK
jgi:hypothetical protein